MNKNNLAKTAYILLGSNLGDRQRNLETAIEKISEIAGLELIATSDIYLSEAVDMAGENPEFLNQVAMIEFQYLPSELLLQLEKIEESMGRENKNQKKPRVIDLDILLFGDEIIETDTLIIPHKELLKRNFAMIPLVEISPDIVHPKTKKLIAKQIKSDNLNSVTIYKDHLARNI